VTYNGDSCRQYVLKLGVAEGNLYPWNYAADPTKPFHGPLRSKAHAVRQSPQEGMTCSVKPKKAG